MTNGQLLKPSLSLGQIYGPDHVYCPRPSPRRSTWLPQDELVMANATGATLPVSGSMPLVCAPGVATASGLALMAEAGFAPPPRLIHYEDGEDHRRILRELAEEGNKLVVQYLHPPEETPYRDYWVRPELLSHINNKASLGELARESQVPERRVVSADALVELTEEALPLVLKAATDESSGGGLDVLVCREAADLASAPDFFEQADRVVVEEYLEFVRNLCLGFAVLPDGRVVYLGGAEQSSRADGRFEGNWLRRDLCVPQAAIEVAREAVAKAASLGYRGCAGIDVGVLESGDVRAFDLNFRLNNSTTILLLSDAIFERHPFTAARLEGWRCEAGFDAMLRIASSAMEQGGFLPLGSYDPRADGHHDELPNLRGLVWGDSPEEVEDRLTILDEGGLSRAE